MAESPTTIANKHIPNIKNEEPLSEKWIAVIKEISILAKLVQTEREAKTLPQSPIVMSMLRQKKIHVLVHMFEVYRGFIAEEKNLAKIKDKSKSEKSELHDAVKHFEMDTHTILCHAFKFLMIHQRSNFATVFALYAGMLKDCIGGGEGKRGFLACGSDFTSFSVLKALVRTILHIGEFEEERMMQPIQTFDLFNLVVKVLHYRMKKTRAFAAAAGVVFLDTCIDTDAFQTTPSDFISTECKKKFIEIQEYLAKPLMKLGMLKRKARHIAVWAAKFKKEVGKQDVDEELVKLVAEQLTITAKMKDIEEKAPSKNQVKYATKKRANIIMS
mmetsp:Transcript_26438/g.49406  ORF Transcript_26438/g.49406 Transcript_26438/m.49406 type:complete len:329 (-) Transcript_26438:202-1188(-)